MIGIIGAMDEEVAAVINHLDSKKTEVIYDINFTLGKVDGKDVVVCQSGIGKVNASFSTAILIDNFDVDFVINVGTAGGLNLDEKQGDVVVSTAVANHDFDLTAFNRKIGEIPDMPHVFFADENLVEKTVAILKDDNVKYHLGLIVSGDQFISKQEQVDFVKEHFENPLAGDMEASAIAQICHKTKKPFIVTRCLSDVFGSGENSLQFDEYLKKAAQISADICVGLIRG
ncbi:MAG: 5'-methylthioadenosine/adenosylhomocysteine nucleosidase [Erysipelotrichaceae bacterium]|nr:5'-methylthioadenosine/adenosylhomocysteine nucleosidase [Erysipelotrichaceae bacterium]MDD3808698.1 5'-methylthioadenosine/adenosylhomocysteine nucleosidase [Erysipelotrichaceae bacterium]